LDKAVEEEKEEQVFWDLTLCPLVLKLWSARFVFGFLWEGNRNCSDCC